MGATERGTYKWLSRGASNFTNSASAKSRRALDGFAGFELKIRESCSFSDSRKSLSIALSFKSLVVGCRLGSARQLPQLWRSYPAQPIKGGTSGGSLRDAAGTVADHGG